MTDKNTDQHPVVVYVINSFDTGGAETGLLALIAGGLFANCQLKIVALVRGRGGLESELIEAGHIAEILVNRASMRVRDMPIIFLRLRQFIRRTKPNILIGSLPQANLLVRLCVLFRKQITFISFEHNSHLAKRVYEVGYRLTSWRVDWLFADAASTSKTAVERLYRRAPAVQTIVPLVSFDSAANRSYSSARKEPFEIVNAARFTSIKNQAALIQAVAILVDANRDVTLTLYGEGPEREACQALAARLGVGPRVHFPGVVSDWSTLPADLFVLTSKHEGLCIVVLEAMHAGIPVVAPMIGGLRDYATPETMHVLASREPQFIARTIGNAMNDLAGLQARVSKAAEMIDRRFSSEAIRATYGEINQAIVFRVQEPRVHIGNGQEGTASAHARPLGIRK